MSVEYRDLSKTEYDGINIDYQLTYTIQSVEDNTYSFTCLDTSTIPASNNIYTRSWKVVLPYTQQPIVGTGSVFTVTIPNLTTALFEYSITNQTDGTVSKLQRYVYANTLSTVDGLLNRTSTSISKEHPSTSDYVYDNANNYKILSLDANEYNKIYKIIMDIMKSGYVKYATGISLDYLASFWMIKRNYNETDDELRLRLENAIRVNNSAVTKLNIKRLLLGAFGLMPDTEQEVLTTRDVMVIEREDVPTYDLSVRGAEFTIYVYGNPTIATNLQSIDDLINRSRAAGVYYNPYQFTFVTELYADINCNEFVVLDYLETQTIFGWGDMQWGSPNEPEPIESGVVTASYTFPQPGTYNISAFVTDTSDNESVIQENINVIS